MFLTLNTHITKTNTTALSAAEAIILDREKTNNVIPTAFFGKGHCENPDDRCVSWVC
jgi:hypothetical protein